MAHVRYSGPVVDAHSHFSHEYVDRLAEIRAANGVGRILNLWDMEWPPQPFATWQKPWEKQEGVLLAFTPDLSDVGSEGFAIRMAQELRGAKALGAAAVKVWKNLGLKLRDTSGSLLRVDDPRLDVLWNAAGELGLPIFIHIADPVAFFEPLEPANERYEELSEHPDWWFGSGETPTFDDLMEQFSNVVAGHPGTTFVGVHMGCYAENLSFVADMLDACPNYNIDTSARIGEIGRQDRNSVREFFISYSDRILFGSDLAVTRTFMWPEDGLYRSDYADFYDLHWEYFETATTDLRHPFPIQGSWRVSGLDLPDDVLSRLYFSNAVRIMDLSEEPSRVGRERE